ncbi:Polyisoprenoid-binding protein YceI [Stigmatella aurantiaca]|uniref:Polyisoprenoid-binding protein YceI n=1 Tax=Stigmatella aurantiaca TaxID=41 RepID=A0A1H7T1J6_STIAU|nr:YceI family protein [Stigmatella aurantiaca]SEL78790.1 Polyisoprenoid-binding protein YceI [Stigmatella aurantiaca]
MNMLLKSAIAAAVFAVPSIAAASTWEIDSAHSSAKFTVKHMMITNVAGEFGSVTGTVNLDDKDPSKTTITASVDTTTINTNQPKRDAHLKSPDFFDVEKYPAMTFKSKSVKADGKDKFKVTGDLTLHGVTKPVTLDVESSSTEIKDPWGGTRRGASATTKLNRKDFGLTWNQALEAGGVAVGDEVKVMIDLELVKKDEAPAAAAPAKK